MGLHGSLVSVTTYSRKQCRSLFWRTRAALKKATKNGGRHQLKFQYDPLSYALNFDDGSSRHDGNAATGAEHDRAQDNPENTSMGLLYAQGETIQLYSGKLKILFDGFRAPSSVAAPLVGFACSFI